MVNITDEAVEAAWTGWINEFDPNSNMDDHMRAAITAALPHLQLGYEVKKLDWRKSSAGKLTAKTPIMEYQIFNEEGFWAIKYDGVHLFCNIYVTRDEAKAAAQADYERRVRECIVGGVDVAAVRRQALEEAATLIDEGFDKAVGKSWRKDGKPSKNDKCLHDKFMYEDCEKCASAAIRNLSAELAQKD